MQYPDVTHVICAGQHDQINHSLNLKDTSLETLIATGAVLHGTDGITVSDWGQGLSGDILISHHCVTERPIEFISYSETASEFMESQDFRIAVTGDYHHAHHLKQDNRLLVNPGSIMRSSKDSINKKPVVYVVDLDNASIIDIVEIPIESDVFLLNEIKREETKKAREKDMARKFDAYIRKVSASAMKPDFPKTLAKVLNEKPPSEKVAKELDSIIQIS